MAAGLPREADEEQVTRLLSAHGRVVRRLRNQHDRLYNGQVYVELEDAGKRRRWRRRPPTAPSPWASACSAASCSPPTFASRRRPLPKARKQAQRDGGGRGGGGGGDYSAVAPPSAGAAVVAERGRILRFEGAGADADRGREDAAARSVAFVDYNRGEAAGYIRFRAAAAAPRATAPTDGVASRR